MSSFYDQENDEGGSYELTNFKVGRLEHKFKEGEWR